MCVENTMDVSDHKSPRLMRDRDSLGGGMKEGARTKEGILGRKKSAKRI